MRLRRTALSSVQHARVQQYGTRRAYACGTPSVSIHKHSGLASFASHAKMASSGDMVMLNVGGRKYATSRATLSKDPNSMLALMFTKEHPTSRDRDGNYVIDRDGDTFKYVLNFLRDGSCVLPVTYQARAELLREAEYYQVSHSRMCTTYV